MSKKSKKYNRFKTKKIDGKVFQRYPQENSKFRITKKDAERLKEFGTVKQYRFVKENGKREFYFKGY